MRRRQSCEIVLIWKNIPVREGISRILHAANFHILLSALSADELPNALQTQQLLFLIIHNGEQFRCRTRSDTLRQRSLPWRRPDTPRRVRPGDNDRIRWLSGRQGSDL